MAPMPYPNDAATPVYDVDVASTPLDDGVSNQRQSTSASFSNLAIYTGSGSDPIWMIINLPHGDTPFFLRILTLLITVDVHS